MDGKCSETLVYYTKFGNLKAPSKTDMCNFVVKAWKEGVSQEVIVKSFVVCGIAKNTSPDQISCLKEDRPAHEALPVVLDENIVRFLLRCGYYCDL